MTPRKIAAGLAGLTMLATVSATPASAIKYGSPDAGEHPYVGIMLAYQWEDTNGDGVQTDDELVAAWRCTGTQMDADTFLTAGHCTHGADAVAIWYGDDEEDVRAAREFISFADAIDQSDPTLDADAWSHTALTHPEYDDAAFYLHDVGVVDDVTLAPDTSFSEYGALPELNYWDGQLDGNRQENDTYTTVGYGLQWSTPTRGMSDPASTNRRETQALWLKQKSHGELKGYRQFNGGKDNTSYVVLTSNANTGGTCSGDSGGPTFIDGTNTVVGITSFGMNETCAGSSGIYRIDQADDLAWLDQFID